MSHEFASKRSSLEPLAQQIKEAVETYVGRKDQFLNATSKLAQAHRERANDTAPFAEAVDRATEALAQAEEEVAELMAKLRETGALDGFLAFVSTQKRAAQ